MALRSTVRTTIDLPVPLYHSLKEQAAREGTSVRMLVIGGIELALRKPARPASKRVRLPLIRSAGPAVSLTNRQIYDHVEFP